MWVYKQDRKLPNHAFCTLLGPLKTTQPVLANTFVSLINHPLTQPVFYQNGKAYTSLKPWHTFHT